MGFFITNKAQFILEPNEDQTGLRKCQLGAIWSIKSHFTTSNNEVASLVSMPTASGKTALMMALCFELQISKLLIIVPSVILRRQICEQFSKLQILKDIGCLAAEAPDVAVYEVEKRKSSREEWEDVFRNYDVVVAHPNSISPYYKDVSPVPQDLIDAVFIDEAHHEPAPTWKALNEYYANVKRVFYTATPFRRDRKRMRAKLVYHYSLVKALDDGIIRPVNFLGQDIGLNKTQTDAALIRSAVRAFREERQTNPSASILIRTDRIEDADELKAKYIKAGLAVDMIHSGRAPNVNSTLIKKVEDGELDGIVCVGIASEGLDLPSLKIAVLHATPRSIPYTIQFLGRISRQPRNQQGAATLIANRDEVRGEVSRLYKSDEAWNRLIPNIIEEHVLRARHYRATQAIIDDFQMPEINVFFSAIVYEVPTGFLYNEAFFNSLEIIPTILHVERESEDAPIVVITAYDKPIEWASRGIYIEDMLDVHIYYHLPDSNLLFELTTSELALKSFKSRLVGDQPRQIPHGRLYQTLSQFNQNHYIMVGMKNAALRGSAQPSYKTIMGRGVQASVRASEGRVFSAGHALLNIGGGNKWGIATKRGRVWSMKRGTVEEFRAWCDELAHLILNGPIITSLPGLSFLASSSPVSTIDSMPLAIILDEGFFRSSSLLIDVEGVAQYRNIVPEIWPVALDTDNNILNCILKLDTYECNLIMNFQSNNLWVLACPEIIDVRLERDEHNVFEKTLQELLNENPPSLIMPNGGVIEGRNRITPNTSIEKLPANLWQVKNWDHCNIQSERYDAAPDPQALPVINKTIEQVLSEFDIDHDILILDDGAYEIADLIWIQGIEKAIHFFHCKASKEAAPGCRKYDCDVLFAQALRSIHWVSNSELLTRLDERLQGNSILLNGNQAVFDNLRNNFRINEWNYNIVMVQPGFRHTQVSNRDRANNNVYELAIPVFERIKACMAEIEIWCN